ncbi:MAG: winged helix-turn-helix domain-containing protein [Candidatus Bathyarchaeota archaeon]|nr:winged helix-turn-helix domain-containing protein [Candidatus Bathyarchaeota archaeon]
MRKSKLELYEDILAALADRHLTVDGIAYTCNMDCLALRQRLDFLLKCGLVEERHYKNKTRYALSPRGLAIYKTLVLTRRLEKLQTMVEDVNDALRILPALSDSSEEASKNTGESENC